MKLRFVYLIVINTFLFAQSKAQVSFTKFEANEFYKALRFSLNGETLLAGGGNKIDQRFANTGQLVKIKSIDDVNDINDIDFISDDTVCISNNGNDVLLYDLNNDLAFNRLKGHEKKVTSISVNIDKQEIFSSSMDKTTILWNYRESKMIRQFKDHSEYVLATAVHNRSGFFASCGADGVVNIYDVNGNKIFSKKISTGWLWSLDFHPDGRHLSVGGDNLVYMISNFETPTPNVAESLIVDGKGYSLRFSPDGKFIAVGTTERYLYLVDWKNNKVQVEKKTSSGIVSDIEFDPDGKSMVTSHSEMKGFLKWDLRGLNILPSKYVKNYSDNIPPQIFVSNPARITEERVIVYTDIIKLQGTVIDESGVFKVSVNAVSAPVSENGTFSLYVPLSYSETPITIEAQDVNKNVSIKRFTVIRKDAAGSAYDAAKAKNHLLVIGINEYKNWRPLYNAVNDANAIAGTLSGLYNFNFSDATILLDSQATKNNIYTTLRSYAEKVGPNDNLMIYFSGHGYFDKVLNEGYWIPVDAQKNAAGDFLSNSDILKIIRSINSQHTLLIADACFSGSMFNESSRGFTENAEKFRSRWGFTSGRLEAVSDGEIGKNSPFAQALLEFLRTNTNDRTAISEIVQYVKMKVPNDANQTPIGSSLKNVGDEGGEFIFYKRQ